jgi:hypothetical protein
MSPQAKTLRKKKATKASESQALVSSMTSKEKESLLIALLEERGSSGKQKPSKVENQFDLPTKVAEAQKSLFENTRLTGSTALNRTPKGDVSQGGMKEASYKYERAKIAPSDSVSNASKFKTPKKSKIKIKNVESIKQKKLLEELQRNENNWEDLNESDLLIVNEDDQLDKESGESNSDEELTSVEVKPVFNDRSRCKVDPPKAFDGTRDEILVRTFFYQLENWFDLANVTESKKLKHLANLLKGVALKWFMAIELSQSPFISYEAAKDRILLEFAPELSNDTARNRLENLFCGKSFTWFLNRFRDICLEIHDMSGGEKFYTFRRKLPDEYRKEVIEQNAATFEEAVSVCCKVELSGQKMRVTTTPSAPSKSGKLNYGKDLTNSGTIVKTDKSKKKHKNWDNVQTLSLLERDRRLKNKLCLNCAEENCQASTCVKSFVSHQ